ncbi:MAG: hypothetical protein ABIQ75_06480 [Flavobacteriales bacterium]
MRSLLLLLGTIALIPADTLAQGFDAAGLMITGRPADARADAMGGGDAAMPGDVRNMLQSPAALVDVNGLELYHRFATPYLFFTKATFKHLALAYRISDRFAIGLRYDDNLLDLNKTTFGNLTFGDMIDPRRGFIYPPVELQIQDRQRTLAGTVAFKVCGGFSVGASMENIDVTGAKIPLSYFSFGLRQRVVLHEGSGWKHGIIASLSCTNASSASETLSFAGKEFTNSLPVIARAGASYTVELRKGWLADTLPSLRFTALAQYDDDLTGTDNTAIRFGGELEVCGLVALRGGWFHLTLPTGAQYGSYQKEFTYGFGIILPVQALTKGRFPISASIDYTALSQPSTVTTKEGVVVPNRMDLEDFQSIGIRLNFGVGQLCKKRSRVKEVE